MEFSGKRVRMFQDDIQKRDETHARVSSWTPADVKQVELWCYMADIICLLIYLCLF